MSHQFTPLEDTSQGPFDLRPRKMTVCPQVFQAGLPDIVELTMMFFRMNLYKLI